MKNKKKIRNLVIRTYETIGALLAIAGFICMLGGETTTKDFGGTIATFFIAFLVGIVLFAIGAYMVHDVNKYEAKRNK